MTIIIPAYGPDARLIKLIGEIQADSDYDILLVDDGSPERCRPIFEQAVQAGCTVLIHEVNKGKGAALRTAFTYLYKNGSREGMICADCDGQHAWKDIKGLAQELPSHPGSILMGCRKFIGDVPFRSRFGNTLTRRVFTLVTGSRVSDTQTGLRGFSAEMLPWLTKLPGNRYEYEMNQLLEAKKAGFRFYCIPIETIYENKNEGSHFHPIKDSIRIYLPIIKFGLSSASCGVLDFLLLFLFQWLTKNLLVSVVSARVISSLCNYLLNRKLVFKTNHDKHAVTLIKYYVLAAVILLCNYLLLSLFHVTLGFLLFYSKILTEAILFFFSYYIQHHFIFRQPEKNALTEEGEA
jgi:glycosyltransferase involved in cell wall biosynthesis